MKATNRPLTADPEHVVGSLTKTHGLFRDAFYHATVGMALVGMDGCYLEVNDELCQMLGRDAAELVGRNTLEFTHPDDRETSLSSYADIEHLPGRKHRAEKRYLRPDGTVVHAVRLARIVPDADGSPAYMYAQYLDVTGRDQRFDLVAEFGRCALQGGDLDELAARASRLLQSTLGVDAVQADGLLAAGRPPSGTSGPPTKLPPLTAEDRDFVRGISNLLEAARARSDAEEKVRHLAAHDALTGLANRMTLLQRLEAALGDVRPDGSYVSLLMLDLDGFKRVNDSLGHGRGDQLLRDVAGRLISTLRPGDTIARLGGDEFAVLLTNLTRCEEAEGIAYRLLDALRAPFTSAGRAVHLGASIGIACARSRAIEVEALLADADIAMYEAKNAGKGRVVLFAPNFRKTAAGRLALEEDLRYAVSSGLFRLQFQPIVDLRSNAWAGTEALLRWPHPTRGLVPPLDFVPLAEDTGLIGPLGRWVLEQALRHRVSWSPLVPEGEHFGIAVNVSVRQLVERGFVEHVRAAVVDSGLPPSSITLEMTESVFMDDGNTNLRVLDQLRDIGVRISIDDFGTGYSSLSYLRRFSIDVMKLDRSFVAGLSDSPEDRAVVRAVIDLADELGIELVAEGIETEEQLAILRGLGCRLGQGYLLHRPLDVDAVVRQYPAV